MTEFPQDGATAWYAIGEYTGLSYKPLMYLGGQPVRGVNCIFIAQQTLVLARPERHIVLVTINESRRHCKMFWRECLPIFFYEKVWYNRRVILERKCL